MTRPSATLKRSPCLLPDFFIQTVAFPADVPGAVGVAIPILRSTVPYPWNTTVPCSPAPTRERRPGRGRVSGVIRTALTEASLTE